MTLKRSSEISYKYLLPPVPYYPGELTAPRRDPSDPYRLDGCGDRGGLAPAVYMNEKVRLPTPSC